MQNNKKIQELDNKLPKGSYGTISRRTGLAYNSVLHFFNGKHNTRLKIRRLIIDEAIAIIKEQQEEEFKLNAILKA